MLHTAIAARLIKGKVRVLEALGFYYLKPVDVFDVYNKCKDFNLWHITIRK
ncbi:hypothetical protein SD77_3696 [Bacillus badius]|uniref:Uncharacterized protein n=1 Tax=Bacillus badius TaxID=1455 RepID=A0ABR5AVZ2_BACBA|nr:hypothetical protein SD78_1494 [Bacillus badius]KIL78895.1 hypothetical protein SD77_3696 [Bacillus badius]